MIDSMEEFEDTRVRFPSIVKPLHEGSSKGIYNSCVVRNPEDLEREVRTILDTYREPALVEEFLPGREFTVAIMGNGDDAARAADRGDLASMRCPPGMNPIYSYEAKWVWDSVGQPAGDLSRVRRVAPEDACRRDRGRVCRRTYRVLRCRDWTRIDVRLDAAGVPHILEVNPLPGILPRPEDNSCFPKAARAAGMTYSCS